MHAVRDQQLVSRIRAGDQEAFNELVKLYWHCTYKLVCNDVNIDDADDVVQDIHLQLVRSIGKFKGESSFASWFYRLSRNVIIDHIRWVTRYRRRYVFDDHALEDLEAQPLSYRVACCACEMTKPLMEIPGLQSEAVYFRYCCGMPVKAIASMLGIPDEAVRGRYRRGVASVREQVCVQRKGR